MDNLARLMAAIEGMSIEELTLVLRFAEFLAKQKGVNMTNETETKPFNFQTCPFCGEPLNMKTDFYPGHYSLRSHIFKCHAYGTTYEVTPVIVGYEARKATGGESPSQEVAEFFEDWERRISKARHKA